MGRSNTDRLPPRKGALYPKSDRSDNETLVTLLVES